MMQSQVEACYPKSNRETASIFHVDIAWVLQAIVREAVMRPLEELNR
jgi:hypothetical protein